MITAKICLTIAMMATAGFDAIAGAVSDKEFHDADSSARLFAMIFVGVTTPR